MSDVGTLVFEEERVVLDWFSRFLGNASSSFATSVYYFDKYYRKCVNDLYNLPFKRENKADIADGKLDAIYIEDMEDFKSKCSYNSILEHMKKNSEFLYEALKNGLISEDAVNAITVLPIERLSKMTKEEVTMMLTDPEYINYVYENKVDAVLKSNKLTDDEVDENLVPLLKLHRLNNLQVKYAHTARIVYLTDLEVSKLGIEDELVKSILYTGALFHDVGRFYQGAYYNSYFEGDLKKTENEKVKDHAEAGYYFSLLDMINLNVLGSASNEDLITHAIAAVVVKKHQLPNFRLSDYDEQISDLKFSDNLNNELLDFVLSCYGRANKFDGGLHGRFDSSISGSAESMRQTYTDGMLDIISAYTGEENLDDVRKIVYGLFSYETPSLVLDSDNINILRSNLKGEELAELEKKIASGEPVLLSPLYNKTIREHKIGKLLGTGKNVSPAVDEFLSRLIGASENADYYSQYDIVGIIDKVFEARAKGEDVEGIKLTDDVSKVIRMSMSLVMDMDKLDILVQRAIKRYPDWKPSSIRVKALCAGEEPGLTHDESLIDVLEKQYKVEIKYDEEGRIILDDALIGIIKHNANVNGKFKKNFGDDFDFSSLKVGEGLDEVGNKAVNSSFEGGTVSIPYDLMEQVHPDLMKRYRVEMDLILPPDLRDNVFKEDKDRRKVVNNDGSETAFPLGKKATDEKHFVWANAFPGVWWQLDQFVMTNMRSMESLRYIKDTGLLDRIGDAYKSEGCPKEFELFVNEVIGFTKEFVDLAVNAKINATGDIIYEEEREGYAPIVLSDKEVMQKIRDEAVVRHHEKVMQESQEQEKHADQLNNMFDDNNVNVFSQKTVTGNDLNSMMGEYNTTGKSSNVAASEGNKK